MDWREQELQKRRQQFDKETNGITFLGSEYLGDQLKYAFPRTALGVTNGNYGTASGVEDGTTLIPRLLWALLDEDGKASLANMQYDSGNEARFKDPMFSVKRLLGL